MSLFYHFFACHHLHSSVDDDDLVEPCLTCERTGDTPVLDVSVDTVIMLDLQSPGCLMGTYGIHALLFHCDFYTLLTNPGYYDGASFGREQNVAIY